MSLRGVVLKAKGTKSYEQSIADKIERTRLLYKDARKKFIAFVIEYNEQKLGKILNKKEREALEKLRELWKESKQHIDTHNYEHFYQMQEFHVILNKKFLNRQPEWLLYIQKVMSLRGRLMMMVYLAILHNFRNNKDPEQLSPVLRGLSLNLDLQKVKQVNDFLTARAKRNNLST